MLRALFRIDSIVNGGPNSFSCGVIMGLANILLWWEPGEIWMQIHVVQPAFGSLCLSINVSVRRLGDQPQKGVLPRRLGRYELDSGFLSPTHSIVWRRGSPLALVPCWLCANHILLGSSVSSQ